MTTKAKPTTEPKAAQINHISVSFSATIPTQAYGNIAVNVAWAADIDPAASPEAETRQIFDRIRLEVAEAVKPIAAAKLKQARTVIESLPRAEREALDSQIGIVRWLDAVAPELKFAERQDTDPRSEYEATGGTGARD